MNERFQIKIGENCSSINVSMNLSARVLLGYKVTHHSNFIVLTQYCSFILMCMGLRPYRSHLFPKIAHNSICMY